MHKQRNETKNNNHIVQIGISVQNNAKLHIF